MHRNLLIFVLALTTFTAHSQTWEMVSPSLFSSDHTISFAIDGTGYSVGGNVWNGYQNVPSAQFYSYDPIADSWTYIDDYPGPNRGYGIGDTWDGKAYLGFGFDENSTLLDDLWEFDPSTNTWTELASCPCAARIHPAFVAHNGKIFVGMGGGSTGNLNDWWEYDIATDTWSQKPSFPSGVRHHPYQFAIGDYVYAGLGHGNGNPGINIYDDWYRYDPVTEVWTQMADIPAEGRVAGTQFSFDGKGYVLSGDGDNHGFMNTGEFWEYDPLLNEWTSLTPHPGTSRWAPSSFIIDGYVYIMTGLSQSTIEDYRIYKYMLEDPPSSTDDLFNDKLLISPNPATDIVTVKLKEASAEIKNVSLINLNGQSVLEKRDLRNHTITLNVQDLPVGIYFLKVESEVEIFSQKIIIQ